MNKRIYRLFSTHAKLDRLISDEQKRRIPDSFRLLRLKKLRLLVKDQLQRLSRRRRSAA